ncbi:CPBP family intramembrane metalloprotease [Sporosarcina sp. PTS2304]|uniref:CPBP family intramembrane glutamic endopeptidase n=1 Tax=Sporosarcina sp. PTS2304 TaxID=2283194 RepID=UPI000E0DE2B6|nr:type II CAAX endopeptidase family protein [Sporosarcina sp. PTS2304]AXI00264.1 CPBP family intramembrane metalloprotease [Sporosarcina sp. PTS2304]
MKNWLVALLIFVTYVLLQLAGGFLAPEMIHYFTGKGLTEADALSNGFAWTLFITQGISAIIVGVILWNNKKFIRVFKGKASSMGPVVLWGVLGFFLAMTGQILGAAIESSFGVQLGSENTELISGIAIVAPIMIFPIVIFAPFLEEVVFRRILFGGLYTKTNFLIAAVFSGVVFSLVHGEPQHLLIYLLPGLAFAFVYYRTKRLLTPMISHFLMNSFVTFVQFNADKLQQLQDMRQSIILFLQ